MHLERDHIKCMSSGRGLSGRGYTSENLAAALDGTIPTRVNLPCSDADLCEHGEIYKAALC